MHALPLLHTATTGGKAHPGKGSPDDSYGSGPEDFTDGDSDDEVRALDIGHILAWRAMRATLDTLHGGPCRLHLTPLHADRIGIPHHLLHGEPCRPHGDNGPPSSTTSQGSEGYRKGGYHPVYIGEKYHAGRYTVLKKLGWGHFSTVWLVMDKETGKYGAMKVRAC